MILSNIHVTTKMYIICTHTHAPLAACLTQIAQAA